MACTPGLKNLKVGLKLLTISATTVDVCNFQLAITVSQKLFTFYSSIEIFICYLITSKFSRASLVQWDCDWCHLVVVEIVMIVSLAITHSIQTVSTQLELVHEKLIEKHQRGERPDRFGSVSR